MKKSITILLITSLVMGYSLIAQSLEQPHTFLNNLTKEVIRMLENNKSVILQDSARAAKLVEPIIEPSISFDLMSSYIVGKGNWEQAAIKDRKEFIHEFKELIIRTYSKTLLAVIDGNIRYFPPKADITNKDRVQIASVVSLENKKVRLLYRLVKEDNIWKIYDILVEKVSLVKGFRSQFAEILQKNHGVAGVVKELKATRELNEKGSS